MQKFLEYHAEQVKGVISGWDRLAFRGTLQWIATLNGLATFLGVRRIWLKDFMAWAKELTRMVRRSCEQTAEALGIPSIYLDSCLTDKEALARRTAEQLGIQSGPICRVSVVEPCYAPSVVGNRASGRLELVMRSRKCVWEYFYFDDPQVGFGHLRLQTWAPFTVKGCLNGRHWLERDLAREGVGRMKVGNCFRAIDNPERAQQLLDAQLACDWPSLLSERLNRYYPVLSGLFEPQRLNYYWSAEETEWATDVMFDNTATLDRLFPLLSRHALMVTDSANVMRFLGQIPAGAALPRRVAGDVRGDRRRRYEGMRVKHSHGGNSVKMYNKAGNVLRVETTINAPRGFRVFRPDARGGRGEWLPMRKGVADLHRRAQVSQQCNERYLDSLAACPTATTLGETVTGVCSRSKGVKRGARALNPWGEKDHRLLEFLAQGQWAIQGLRNRDLALWLDCQANERPPDERRRLSARVSRQLRLLRAHGLIRKVPKTHRYQVTEKGKQVATLVVTASNVPSKTLMEMAA